MATNQGAVPTGVVFPVWLVASDGRSELVLDANGYVAAVSAGAAPFSATTPSRTLPSDRGVSLSIVETNHSTAQKPPGKLPGTR